MRRKQPYQKHLTIEYLTNEYLTNEYLTNEYLTNESSTLVSSAEARALDREASAQWGLDSFALVEAAGRICARVLTRRVFSRREKTRAYKPAENIVALAGSGNNAADALVTLRTLILDGYAPPAACQVFITRLPPENEKTPLSQAVISVRKLGVPVVEWNAENAAAVATALASADTVIDGIAGTGLNGPLYGPGLEMAEAINKLGGGALGGPFIVSIDCPSGNFDGWRPGMPIVAAHATLAIQPQKLCLYTPAARAYAGAILPVNGIFPRALVEQYGAAELVRWESAAKGAARGAVAFGAAARIPPVPQTAHKYERGLVEIRAGSVGSTGAAILASRGAQAAGAGLVRLIVDPSLYPLIAPACSGVMAVPGGPDDQENRFPPSAVLLGPGWGRSEDRIRLFEACLPLEKKGVPLILDADAIPLTKNIVFNGNAVLTPHAGEFAALTGLAKDEVLSDTVNILKAFSAEKKAHILFKSHVTYIASPDGRIGIVDGMNPLLAAGGSGDVLAGFCAAIAARSYTSERARSFAAGQFDGYACACAAAALLARAAESKGIAGRFADPAELAHAAAGIAGSAWLGGKPAGSKNER